MASNITAAPKISSRWGSFLSSVESRLDTILADEDPQAGKRTDVASSEQPSKKDVMTFPPPRAPSPARNPSANRTQDRLNEKLARAMANKNLAKKGDASVASSGVPSRTGSPANVLESPRVSVDVPREAPSESGPASDQHASDLEANRSKEVGSIESNTNLQQLPQIQSPFRDPLEPRLADMQDTPKSHLSVESPESFSTRPSFEITRPTTISLPESPKLNGVSTPAPSERIPEEYEKAIEKLTFDSEAAELRRQEETHAYLERIDALQAKLQYLTKEAAEMAKTASSQAKSGSFEQKLAAKDEKIALLIDEGQRLSQTELKHMTLIKKLRAKSSEDEKAVAEANRISEKHEKTARDLSERAKRAEAAEKRAAEKIIGLAKVERDMESIKTDRDGKDSLIQDLQFQLSEITSAAKQAEERAQTEALQEEQKRAAELADELSRVKMEKELVEKDHQSVLRELREKAEREKERARVAEIERQGEQNILESRLEAYRARAEEASAGQGGDVQAKLLRQIETLQNQYAVASENWQGIEGSLMSRMTALEKERDEISKREGDVRRKAREMNIKSKRLKEELDRATSQTQDLDSEKSSLVSQLTSLQDRLNKTEADVTMARSDLTAEREAWQSRQAQRLEEERSRFKEEFIRSPSANIYSQFRNESPILQNRTRKSSNAADRSSPHSRRISGIQGLGLKCTSSAAAERPLSRRTSSQLLKSGSSDFRPRSMERQDSASTILNISVNNGIPETPSIDYDTTQASADDDFFAGIHTPATPPERTINDLVSASTAGAGPSVQLVERMSAAVRKLESEKAAHKDELVRLGGQRDEARQQVVELMRDNEGKKAVDERVKVLETELEDFKARYDTTLEMLGEKSEKVEELKADVMDLKQMMREMVEERVK